MFILHRTVAVNSTSIKTEESSEPLKHWQQIPGPSSYPVIGQLRHYFPGGELHIWDGFYMAERLHKKYGPIVKLDGLLGTPTLLFVFDVESCSHILRSENWMPVRRGFLSLEYYRSQHKKNPNTESIGTGLLTDQGEKWKDFRSKVNPVMLQPKTIKLYESSIKEVSDEMIERLRSLRNENNMIDGKFDVEMNLWALESVAVVALGVRLNCFNENTSEDSPAKTLIRKVHDAFNLIDKLDFKPSLWKYYATKNFKKAMQTYEDLENLTKYYIEQAMTELKTKEKSNDDEKGVLEKLLEIDDHYAYIMAADMLFAGVDTTANTVMGTLYLLAAHPEKQQKVREEIMAGEKKTYLKACIKESLRLMPIVSGNLRVTTKEYNILGYKIPKESYMVLGHHYFSQLEENYPRTKEFIPERWICSKDDPLYYGNAHPLAYSPFGFGARSCIGRRIAELEIETFITGILKNFQVEWSGPPAKVTQKALNYVTGPFNYVFKDL